MFHLYRVQYRSNYIFAFVLPSGVMQGAAA
jgi:hypothetical protein